MNNRQGFTLTEILLATIIMSMIMTGVIAFVQYGGDIWHRGYNNLSAKNYSRTAFEYIKDELLNASVIASPTINQSSPTLQYKVSNQKYIICIDNNSLIKKKYSASSATTRAQPEKPIRLARNVKNFCVNRISSWTFKISIQIIEDRKEPEYDARGVEIEPPTISSESMILLAPGV